MTRRFSKNLIILSFFTALISLMITSSVFADGNFGSGEAGSGVNKSCVGPWAKCNPRRYARPNTCTGSSWFRTKTNGDTVVIPEAPFNVWGVHYDWRQTTTVDQCKNSEYVYYYSFLDPQGTFSSVSYLDACGYNGKNLGGPMGTSSLRHASIPDMTSVYVGGNLKYYPGGGSNGFYPSVPATNFPTTGYTWNPDSKKETYWERLSWQQAQAAFTDAFNQINHNSFGAGSATGDGSSNSSSNIVTYIPTSSNLAHPSNGGLRWFCYSSEEPYEPPTYCDFGPTGAQVQKPSQQGIASKYFGNTTAQSSVENRTNGQYQETSNLKIVGKHQVSIFAKPGDNIVFTHSLCSGAQKVSSNGPNGQGARSQQYGTEGHFNLAANIDRNYRKHGGLSDDSYRDDKHYVFGGANRLLLGWNAFADFNLVHQHQCYGHSFFGECTPWWLSRLISPNSMNSTIMSKDQYGFRSTSPANPVSLGVPDYSCSNHAGTGYKAPSFQILGKTPGETGSCNASKLTGSVSNVGTAILQRFSYLDITRYVNYYHDRNGKNFEITSFDQAVKLGTENGKNNDFIKGNLYFGKREGGKVVYPLKEEVVSYKTPDPSTHYTNMDTKVIVPYNFQTETSASMPQKEVVYVGERVHPSATVKIKARYNPDVFKNKYSTRTPDSTKAKLISFTIDPNESPSRINTQGGITPNPYTFYRGRTQTLATKDGPIPAGEKTADRVLSFDAQYDIPDHLAVGSKFCIATAVWPADSHGLPDSSLNTGANDYGRGSERAIKSGLWRISNLQCRTVAKKPNFQVWGGGVYTNGNITTSLSRRHLSGAEHIFGSWGEHEVIAGGSIKGFASGASLGYNDIGNLDWNNLSSIFSLFDGGFVPKKGYNPRFCEDLSPLTIANHGPKVCNTTNPAGRSGISSLANNIQTLASQLRNRYILNPAANKIVQGQPQPARINLSDTENCNSNLVTCKNNGRYIFIKGDAEIDAYELKATSGSNRTISIYATGNIKIIGNITYENGKYGLLVDHGLYKNLAELPQVLIFAQKNIEVAQDVTQVDAWLIADKGTVNTCADFQSPNLAEGKYGTDSGTCSHSIIFNGPVIAKNLALNRVAGADPGSGIVPGEIFNLRPDTYLWAYNQAQLFSQANTTYIRELAPRY